MAQRQMNAFGVAVVLIVGVLQVTDVAATAPDKAPAAAASEKASLTAVEAAKSYAELLKSSKPTEAVRTYWDMDAMLTGIFGDNLRRNSPAERAEMERLLLGFVEKVYANPDITNAMKQATFSDFKSENDQAAGVTSVTFNCHIQGNVLPNTLRMKRVDGKWRIQDAGANGRMMVPAIRAEYEPQSKRITPLDYIKALASETPGAKAD